MRPAHHIESLAIATESVRITTEEARTWILAHRDEPIDCISVMLMAQGYDCNNCQEPHNNPENDCDCFTQLNDFDVWELDERTGKPVIEFAEWWGPFELWVR